MVPDWVAKRVGAEEWEPVGGGYTRAGKWLATFPDGSRVFVKAAEDELALRMASVELIVHESVSGPFLPRLIDAWEGDGRTALVLEDLSSAYWPPPYPEDVGPVFHALGNVARATPPPGLRRLDDRAETPWDAVRKLGVCSSEWLNRAIEPLREAERAFSVAGEELVHYDVWSDNLCFADRGVVLVDWAAARVGNRWIDVGYAVLSILAEGGTPPALGFRTRRASRRSSPAPSSGRQLRRFRLGPSPARRCARTSAATLSTHSGGRPKRSAFRLPRSRPTLLATALPATDRRDRASAATTRV